MDFDGVEACFDGESGGVGVRGDDVVDVVAGGLLGEPHADRIEEPHRRQSGGLIGSGVGHRTGVADLCADRRALGVDRVGEPAQPRHRLRAHPDSVALGAAARGHRAVGDGGHPDAAGGRQPVIFDEVVGDQCAGCAGLECRRLDDAVAQRDRAQLGGAQDVRRAQTYRERARLADVGAITLDGKVTRDEIFVDLKERVAALTAAGRTPGLGTILVGDDPGSQAYVRGKHSDCAKVGITSLRRDLPADISQAKLNETIDELNANPECTGYIVQLPLPKHSGRERRAGARRPGQGCRRVASDQPGPAGAGYPGAAAVHRARHRAPVAALRRRDRRRARRGHRSWCHGRPSAGADADPPLRERHGDVVPHRNS